MTDPTFNLLQLEQRPNWYDHLPKVEAAMRAEADVYDLREEFGWESDEGGWAGPDPLHPGEMIIDGYWEDRTGLPLPEDMTEDDKLILELMQAFGKESDSYSGVAAVFDLMKSWAKRGVFQ